MVRWVFGSILYGGAGRSAVVRAVAHGAMGRRIDPSWAGRRGPGRPGKERQRE